MAPNRLRVGIVGASGYIGSRLCDLAIETGHTIVPFSRTERSGFRIFPSQGSPDFSDLNAIVNLAGESILGRWTSSKKQKILASRVKTTSRVVEALTASANGPKILINASAVGYYGDTGEREVDESSLPGSGFLANTCHEWEAATTPATLRGIRVVRVRTGFVIGPGGAMRLLLPLFRLGLGGSLGNGQQWMSCIHVDDVAGMILLALENERIVGALNAVMPMPIRNVDFTRTLAAVLHRPAIFPAPAFALRLLLGELSHLLLDSIRVVPRVALSEGYDFRFSKLSEAFQSLGNSK